MRERFLPMSFLLVAAIVVTSCIGQSEAVFCYACTSHSAGCGEYNFDSTTALRLSQCGACLVEVGKSDGITFVRRFCDHNCNGRGFGRQNNQPIPVDFSVDRTFCCITDDCNANLNVIRPAGSRITSAGVGLSADGALLASLAAAARLLVQVV